MKAKWELSDPELEHLDNLALAAIMFLAAIGVGSFFAGVYALMGNEFMPVLGLALIGLSGSAVAALTSCLDRYATGFEREDGTSVPLEAEGKAKFNRRMARWFFARPFLGLLVAPVFVWGIALLADDVAKFGASPEHRGFTAFMAGFLAKSVLDVIKALFKNVFLRSSDAGERRQGQRVP